MIKKILAQLFVLVLAVHISISFAQQPVTVTVFTDVVENDLAGFKIYQDDNETPIATIKSAVIPWVWQGDVTLINGKASFRATAFDTAGNESEKGPPDIFDPPPCSPTIAVKITVEVPAGSEDE